MADLNHDHITQLVGFCITDRNPKLVTLWRPFRSLNKFLKYHCAKLQPDRHFVLYSRQIAEVFEDFFM